MTTSAEHKALVRRLEAIWDGDLDVVDELVAEGFTNHNPVVPDAPPGPTGFKQNVVALRTAFPDLAFETEDLVAEGDRVVLRGVGRGTHEGAIFGVEPTGRSVAFEAIVIFRFEGGQIVERWAQTDVVGLLRQLGAFPEPDEGAGADG